jgi:rod shape-determining protein MreB
MIQGLDKRLRQETNLPVIVADDPLMCVAKGTGMVLEDMQKYAKVLLKSRRDN